MPLPEPYTFTFQYASIKPLFQNLDDIKPVKFTFQYASIKPRWIMHHRI